MASYLEQLKKAVADAFQNASDKETVDKMVSIQAAMDGVEQENADLAKKNHELLTAYKEAVAHPGITSVKEPDPTTVQEPFEMPDLSDLVLQAMNKE
jgi:ATP-dependent protease HslVU (ClpYQ) ATPase subunit